MAKGVEADIGDPGARGRRDEHFPSNGFRAERRATGALEDPFPIVAFGAQAKRTELSCETAIDRTLRRPWRDFGPPTTPLTTDRLTFRCGSSVARSRSDHFKPTASETRKPVL